MSVFLDHISVKTTLQNYNFLFHYFQKLLPEEIFIHGKDLDAKRPWAGFFIYFDNGFFMEFSDPSVCENSKSVGMSFSCINDLRESFINVMIQNTKSKFERIAMPEEEPIFEVCSIQDGEVLSARASVYSDTWYKEWGQEISKLSLLSPFGKVTGIRLNLCRDDQESVNNNFNWLDPNIAKEGLKFIPISGGESGLEINYNSSKNEASIEIEFELDEVTSGMSNNEFLEFQIEEKYCRLRVNL